MRLPDNQRLPIVPPVPCLFLFRSNKIKPAIVNGLPASKRLISANCPAYVFEKPPGYLQGGVVQTEHRYNLHEAVG